MIFGYRRRTERLSKGSRLCRSINFFKIPADESHWITATTSYTRYAICIKFNFAWGMSGEAQSIPQTLKLEDSGGVKGRGQERRECGGVGYERSGEADEKNSAVWTGRERRVQEENVFVQWRRFWFQITFNGVSFNKFLFLFGQTDSALLKLLKYRFINWLLLLLVYLFLMAREHKAVGT